MLPQVTASYGEKSRSPTSPTSIPMSSPLEGDEVLNVATDEEELFPQAGDPWEKCYSTVKNYDDDLCSGWRDEVDKLLIFAGLFSATVTAFLLESYTKLSEDPADKTNWLLEQLLLQAHNANIGNISTSSQAPARPAFTPAAIDIRLNIFWFLSLSLSLATVVLGILCIQWLREYQRAAPLDPKDAISLRQIRYEGFVTWKVPTVLLSLPVLLHLSLILFFAGLLDLLWNLNHIVAAFVTVVSGVVLIFISITTLLPGLQMLLMPKGAIFMAQCPYKSPQAWTFHRFLTWIVNLSLPNRRRLFTKSFRLNRYNLFFANKDWVDFDVSWRKMRKVARKDLKPDEITDVGKGLVWIEKHLGHSTDVITAMYRCIKGLASRDGLHIVSRLSHRIGTHLKSKEVSENAGRLSEVGRQELASLLFLEQQTRAFPQLDDRYFQLLVRFLAAQLREVGLFEDAVSSPSKLRDHLSIVLPFASLRIFSMYEQPKDRVLEYLLYLRILASNGFLNSPDLQKDVWDLLREILLPRSTPKNDQAVKDEEIAKAVCEVMAALVRNLLHRPSHLLLPETPLKSPVSPSDEGYLKREEVSESLERIEHIDGQPDPELELLKRCASGALQAFPSNRDFGDLRSSISPVLTSIDDRMKEYKGTDPLLDRVDAQRWSQLMRSVQLESMGAPHYAAGIEMPS